MTEADICSGCGKEVGTGTLLDEFPDPPSPSTTLHRLYMAFVMIDDKITIEEILSRSTGDVTKTVWETFASRYRCLVCKAAADEAHANQLLEGVDE